MAKLALNHAGFRALRTSAKVRKYVQEQAEDIAADAGVEAFETVQPRNRARSAVVGPKRKEAEMLRALGSAR